MKLAMFDLHSLELPVIQAPMAGGPSTPTLAAAVARAGGMGFLAAGYKTADAVAQDIAELRGASAAPFGLNIFSPSQEGRLPQTSSPPTPGPWPATPSATASRWVSRALTTTAMTPSWSSPCASG